MKQLSVAIKGMPHETHNVQYHDIQNLNYCSKKSGWFSTYL